MYKRVLGIDPGLQNFGYAVIEHSNQMNLICAGEINIPKIENNRLAKIYNGVSDLIKVYNPDLCIIEKTFMNQNPLSSLNLGQARGVILLSFQMYDKPYIEITPNQIKKKVCGMGTATKEDIQSYVYGLFDVSLSHNAADAIAICLCASKQDIESI